LDPSLDASALDPTRPPRSGEELDLARLEPYLRERIPGAGGPLVVEQFPSGYSNLTYLLRCGSLELVLRRPPFGNVVKSAHDMGREFRVLSALQAGYPLAPKPYLYCDDPDILGAPFYVMERRRGVILRGRRPKGVQLAPEQSARLSRGFVACFADLHKLDYAAAGLGDLGRKEGYVERQVGGWMDRYQRARTDEWADFDAAGEWLRARHAGVFPAGGEGAALVHNDFKYDNVLLDPDDLSRVVGILDWEMCTVGEPLLDLGTSLAYWVEAGDEPALQANAFGPTALPGSLSRRELAALYGEATGADLGGGRLVFAYVFGLYKLGVIVQQIYARYVRGLTQDPRFAHLGELVGLLGRVGGQAIARGSI
jgi:aminoglycoside phosphotransferase (APT) family kinase protein